MLEVAPALLSTVIPSRGTVALSIRRAFSSTSPRASVTVPLEIDETFPVTLVCEASIEFVVSVVADVVVVASVPQPVRDIAIAVPATHANKNFFFMIIHSFYL